MNMAPANMLLLKALFGSLLFVLVTAMALIDFREMILPNRLNALLAAGGVGQAAFLGRPNLLDAGFGALAGFISLFVVAALFRRVRGIDGLGCGDQKFSAAAGLWIGWEKVSVMLLIASCLALVFAIVAAATGGKLNRDSCIPFGPFLSFATFVCWLLSVAMVT